MNQWHRLTETCLQSSELIVQGTVNGYLPSGKNNYLICGNRMIKKTEVKDYEEWAGIQLLSIKNKKKLNQEEGNVALVASVWFQSFRRDVDTILFCDLLQKTAFIKNDRCIRIKMINGVDVDKKNPRVEFALYRLKGDGK